ncbi:MAG: TVP38/TMEM64 family protein [Rubrobacteraceae bacterium]
MSRNRLIRLGILALFIVAVVVAARLTGLTNFISFDNLGRLRSYIEGFGPAAPLVCVLGYAVATVACLPGTPLTLLAGLAFGPVLGSIYVLIGATAGLTLAFLVARYAARGLVASWVEENERLKKLDGEVERQGWRILVITRLVPLFPFNLQNYAYGLTKIGLGTYVLVSAICIIPGVIAYTFAGGSVTSGDLTRTFIYLGVAAVFFVLLSLVPGWVRRRSRLSEKHIDSEEQ